MKFLWALSELVWSISADTAVFLLRGTYLNIAVTKRAPSTLRSVSFCCCHPLATFLPTLHIASNTGMLSHLGPTCQLQKYVTSLPNYCQNKVLPLTPDTTSGSRSCKRLNRRNAPRSAGRAGSEVVGAGCPVQQGAELCPTPHHVLRPGHTQYRTPAQASQ